MMANNQHNEPENFQVSPKLIEDLNILYTPAEKVPLQADRKVLEQARRHFTRSKRHFWRHAVRWSSVAAAAVIVFLFVLVDPVGDHSTSSTKYQPGAGERLAKTDQQEKKEEVAKPAIPQKPHDVESDITVAMKTDHDFPANMGLDTIAPLGTPPRYTARDESSSVMVKQALRKQDLDRSGRVDILDAFFLARQIEKQPELSNQWDVTGDGNVNQNDVDAIASTAVRVRKDVL